MNAEKVKIDIVEARKDEYLKEEFFKQNIKLVYKIVNGKLKYVPIEKEDKISLGLFGLLQAFNTYDVDSNYAFSTYAYRCITNQILMENRRAVNKHRKNMLSLEGAMFTNKDNEELLLMDMIASEENEYDIEDFLTVKKVYKRFVEIYSEKDPKLIKIFNMYVFEEIGVTEIGESLGITQSWTSRMVAKTIKAIQEIAIEMGVIEDFSRFSRRRRNGEKERSLSKDNEIKRKLLYIILNYPELNTEDIYNLTGCNGIKIGKFKESYSKGKFLLSPDDSIKDTVENYIKNKD